MLCVIVLVMKPPFLFWKFIIKVENINKYFDKEWEREREIFIRYEQTTNAMIIIITSTITDIVND